jgi:hypothetical protein
MIKNFETIEINLEELPIKYLALCEILAELSETTIVEVDEAVDDYVRVNEYLTTELPKKGEGLH